MAKDTEKFENTPLPEAGGMTLVELRARQQQARSLLVQLKALFPGLIHYTKDERPRNARRGKILPEEEKAIASILDAAAAAPGSVAPLADKDYGKDGAAFETDLLRTRLEVSSILRETGEEFAELGELLTDTATDIGLKVKPVASAAYELLKPAAKHDEVVSTALSGALDYHHEIARSRKQKEDK
jgi:hypothetical protein